MTQDNAQIALRAAGELTADAVLTRRLVERHGLDETTAWNAVRQTRARQPNEHTDLVRAEAAAVLAEIAKPFIELADRLAEAMRPALQQIARSISRMGEQARTAQAQPQVDFVLHTEHARPAWESPYGPLMRRRSQ